MFELVWPWLLLLIPLPFLLRQWLPPSTSVQAALMVPFMEDFSNADGAAPQSIISSWLVWLLATAWVLLVFASARPLWQGEPINLPIQGRDLMLAVDLSGSMEERDFVLNNRRINRLQATKVVAGQFIEQRKGDRLGLILFGEKAYLQVPLTFDLSTVKTLLNESFIGMAGKRTAIGDAIGLTIKRLQNARAEKVLILLSDGRNTAGEMEPSKAAELAVTEGLKIYTIGVGSQREGSFFGMSVGGGDLDEKTLKAVAEATGGRYFRARNTQQLAKIYSEIDALEPVESEEKQYRPKTELFFWPLAACLILLMLVMTRRGLRA